MGAAAAGLASGLISTLGSMVSNYQASNLNYKYGEMAADNADARQRAQYYDLYSPQARMSQIQEAGLSPSLMYGMQGATMTGGNANGAMGQGAGGQQGKMFNLDMMQAALMDAQVRKTNAEADNIEGVDREKANAEIQLVMSQAGLADANKELVYAETEMQRIQTYIADTTKDIKISEIEYMCDNAFAASQKAWNDYQMSNVELNISKETAQYKIEQNRLIVENMLADLSTKYATIQLTKEQIKRLGEQTAIDWQNARSNSTNASANIWNAKTNYANQKAQQKFWEETIETNLKKILTDKEMAEFSQNEETKRTWIRLSGQIISSVLMNNAIMGSSVVNAVSKVLPGSANSGSTTAMPIPMF